LTTSTPPVSLPPRFAPIVRLLLSPDGRQLGVIRHSNGRDPLFLLECVETATGELSLGESLSLGEYPAADLSGSGRFAAVANPNGGLRVLDLLTHKELLLWKESPAQVSSLRFAPNELTLAVGMNDGTALILNLAGKLS